MALGRSAVCEAELPTRAQYWFGKGDPRPFALFRILFGLTLCHDLYNYTRDLRAFLCDDGMLPRTVPVDPFAWGVFTLTGTFTEVATIFGAGCCAVLAFTLGYRTRLMAALSLLFLTSLASRNPYVTDGGDDLVRCLMFVSIFSNLSGCWSIETWSGRRTSRAVSMLGPRFLQLHIALLYFCAARLKFRRGWLSHNVIFQVLQLTGFVRPPGALLLNWPSLCRATTVMTLGFEFAFAFLALSPWQVGWSRGLAVAAGGAVQIGILLTMRVGVFTECMLASMALFARPEWFDWLAENLKLPKRNEGTGALYDGRAISWQRALQRPMQSALFVLLAFNFLRLAWGPFVARRLPPPRWFVEESRWLWLDQPFGLFDVVYPIPRWFALGTTELGTQVDVLPVAIPDLVPQVRWRFSRWYKFTFKEQERPYHFAELGQFVCQAYLSRGGERLRDFRLFIEHTPPRSANAPEPVPDVKERWHQVCASK